MEHKITGIRTGRIAQSFNIMNILDPEVTDEQVERIYQQRKALKDKMYRLLYGCHIEGAGAEGLAALGVAYILTEPKASIFEDVRAFTLKMGLPLNMKNFPLEMQKFRDGILKEEFDEYEAAVMLKHKEKQMDALLDIIYVAAGTLVMHGWDAEEGWRRVHNANMKKEPGKPGEGKAIAQETGMVDVIKPEGWKAPKMQDLL